MEVSLRGVYVARTVSNVFKSSEILDHEQRKAHALPKESTDSGSKKHNAKEAIYCIAQIVNTSLERITLTAGTQIADVYNVTSADLVEYIKENDVHIGRKVLKTSRYPKQMDPKVREQNARVPELLEEKFHLRK